MPDDPHAPIRQALARAITSAIPDATVEIDGGGGHYTLTVRSAAFQGQTLVASHQLVYRAIAPLLAGPDAPVHAIDTLRTIAV